ncbi:hypothetical protein RQP46_008951 [Phenoliferia psychrophenolica]
MPATTGPYGICVWFWLTATGTANFYMTYANWNGPKSCSTLTFPRRRGFYCNVTGATSTNKIAAPKDPINCLANSTDCQVGAKKALYAYNSPSNVVFPGNENRPG